MFRVPRLKYIFAVWLLLAYVACCTYLILFSKSSTYLSKSDFRAYYLGSYMLREGRIQDVYDTASQAHFYETYADLAVPFLPFRNSPLAALLFVPLTYLEFFTAYKVLAVINFFILAAAFYFIYMHLKISYRALYLGLFFFGNYAALYYGQLSPLILLISVFILLCLKYNKAFFAGLVAGLLLLKPQFFILAILCLFITPQKKSYLKGLMFMLVLFCMANTYMYGMGFIADFTNFLIFSEINNIGTAHATNFTLFSLLPSTPLFYLVHGLFLLLSVLLLTSLAEKSLELAFSVAIVCTLFLNIHIQFTDLVLLIIPLLIFYSMYLKTSMLRYLVAALVMFFTPILGLMLSPGLAAILGLMGCCLVVHRFARVHPNL